MEPVGLQKVGMAKKMLIDATHAEETRVVVVDGNKVEDFDFESENKRQLAGNIYLAKVTRVEPSLQAAFVEYGGNRHGFLAFSEIHPDYYQIPVADREALLAEERAFAEEMAEEEDRPRSSRSRSRGRGRSRAASANSNDAVETAEAPVSTDIPGMDVVDLGDQTEDEGHSPVDFVAETPVETPAAGAEVVAEDADTDVRALPEEGAAEDVSADADADVDVDADAETYVESLADAADRDDQIESVADEDVTEEIRQPRKPRPRKYKIQEVIKVRQILLVQVVKEERGNKGAALTTYLSLAGRYCVLMPNTARGGGISRKITNAADRKKLKEIAGGIDVPEGAGLIIRTAGAQRTKSEIKRDYEYLQRLWEQIRELTLRSTAPAKIYEEGDLIKRSIRDLYNRDIDEVLVEGEGGYRVAKDFMKMIMPSHAKNVKHYTDPMPLLARFQVESYLASMFNPTVQLRSGGYIVIGVTEALVAIDVNSGRATKKGSIEETALETNLEAAEEIARQLRLRDLAGLIVIDFIDMEERKNNASVEKRFKDKLKTDRARIQVGRISGFGLLEMSRQRLRPGMIEATTQPCPHCHGTGLIRSDDSLALSILRQIEEEGVRRRSREVLVKAPVGIVNYLMNHKREHIAQIEARYGMAVRIEGDPALIPPDFSLEKFKTATRVVQEVAAPVVSVDASLMPDEVEEEDDSPEETGEERPKKKRRRRRKKKPGSGEGQREDGRDWSDADGDGDGDGEADDESAAPPEAEEAAEVVAGAEDAGANGERPKRSRSRGSRGGRGRSRSDTKRDESAGGDATTDAAEHVVTADAASEADAVVAAPDDAVEDVKEEAAPEAVAEAPKPAPRKRSPRKPAKPKTAKAEAVTDPEPQPEQPPEAEPAVEPGQTPAAEQAEAETAPVAPQTRPEAAPKPDPATERATEPEKVLAEAEEDEGPSKPKKRGWWSLGR